MSASLTGGRGSSSRGTLRARNQFAQLTLGSAAFHTAGMTRARAQRSDDRQIM